jgi:hypothetical protein
MMKLSAGVAMAIALAGCVTSSVDANRKLWQGSIEERAAHARVPLSADATDAPEVEARLEARGVAILAQEVLGRPVVPAKTETTSNRCLFSYGEKRTQRAAKEAREVRSARSMNGAEASTRERIAQAARAEAQARAGEHVFGNFYGGQSDGSDDGLVPTSLRETQFVKKVTSALVEASGAGEVQHPVSLSRREIVDFGRQAFRLSSDQEEAGRSTVGRLLRMYLSAYLQGKFVDRSGRLYAKPEIVNTIGGDAPTIEIGTDVAAAFTGVAMEALTDAAFGTPVLKKGDQYFTESNRIPTFAALFGVVEAIQEDGTRRGVTELELSLIRYVSDLAGTKSRILSDLVFGLLREGEVQLVVGAHFSFGDHDTLRVLLDTLFDVASRKITSHLAYKGLSEFTYEEANGRIHASGASDTPLGRVIALLLQEQALLAELLPAGAE